MNGGSSFHLMFKPCALLAVVWPAAVLLCGTDNLAGQTISDSAISNTIVTVARHWRQMSTHTPLKDGSYPVATSLSQAQSAASPAGLEWDYQWGLNLYGQLRAFDATGDTNIESFVLNHNLIVGRYYGWLRSLTNTLASTSGLASFQTGTVLGPFFQLGKLDNCGSMTEQMLEGARHQGGPTIQQLQMGMVTANYISTGQARLSDGTLYRPTDLNAVWADDLYMSCPFLVRWYELTGDTNYLTDATRQVANMAGYLQSANGIWYHGYFLSNHAVNGIKWGRGNGWAMVSTVEILSAMPASHPARTNLLNILRRQIAGIESVQAPDGLWRQVVDDSSAWEDTSCSGMFVYCIARAVNQGWIDATNLAVARRGFAAIAQKISPAGVISNVCPSTGLSTSLSYYLTTKTPETDGTHAPGPAMLAGAELLMNPKLKLAAAGNVASVSWNAGLVNYILQTTTDFTHWNNWTNFVTDTNGQSLASDAVVGHRFFRLSAYPPAYPAIPLTYDADSLAYETNGLMATILTNVGGGEYISCGSTGTNNSITFILTNVPAGDYDLELAFRSGSRCGIVALTAAGLPLGGALDEYWPAANEPLWDFGSLTVSTNGNCPVTLTVVGRDAASGSFTITADKFLLTPRQ